MNQARRIVIHHALLRPLLLAGGERKLVMLNYTLIAMLLFGAGINWLSIISAIILATLGHTCLVKVAKHDPMFSYIYKRHIRYRSFYLAQASVMNGFHPVTPAIHKGNQT